MTLTSPPIRRGLTLGKFAPLHRGHQLVIETALAEMDEVWVVIYDSPETTPVPLNVRAQWLRDLYPAVYVIEAWDGPADMGDTPEIRQLQETYILRRLGGERVTHFYSGEFYGEHMSRALGAVDRRVDPDRQAFPISGTLARQDPYAARPYLHPRVYRDLITNVVLLGAPSTGKTTLAERLAREFGTVWMPEYGREYWEAHHVNRRLTLEQLEAIAVGHLEREEARLWEANRYLFTDTNAVTTYVFSQHYHGRATPGLARLAEAAAARYDHVFVCGDEIPYADTWDRSGAVDRAIFQKRVLGDLLQRKTPFEMLTGSLEARAARVKEVLARRPKYGLPGGG